MEQSLQNLNLSVRALNCLKKINVDTIDDLLVVDIDSLRGIRNLGRKTFNEIAAVLQLIKGDVRKQRIARPINTRHPKYPQLLRNVSELGLSKRVITYFETTNLTYIGDLITKNEKELLTAKNLGRKSVKEIKARLSSIGLSLNSKVADWPPSDVLNTRKQFSRQLGLLRKSHANKLLKVMQGNASCLEDELEAILKLYAGDINCLILQKLYGWDGKGEKTLETVGNEYGITRERVRQIKEKFEHWLDYGVLKYADFPLLKRTLKIIEHILPATEANVTSALLSSGLIKTRFNLEGISSAVRILRKKPAYRIEEYKGHRFMFSLSTPGIVRKSLSLALRSASKYGMTNVEDISSQIMEITGMPVDSSFFASIIPLLRPDFKWLDRSNGWFWFENIPRNRLLNVIKKILSTNNKVDISELRAGISRCHRMEGIVPPRAILMELCKQLSWCSIEGRMIVAEPQLDWEKELKGSIDWAICAIFKQAKSLLSYEDFKKECLSIGMNEHSFKAHASYSPITLRYAPRVYGLIGTEIVPGEIDSIVSKTKPEKPLSDYGWTNSNEIWLTRQLSRGGITFGSLYLPASLKPFIEGNYKLKSGNDTLFGTITIKDNHIVGMRNFFNRRGAEPGDFVALLFNSSTREAKVYLGNDELLSKFDSDA